MCSLVCLSQLVQATIINHHSLGGLKDQKFIFLQFQNLEGQDQGAILVGSPGDLSWFAVYFHCTPMWRGPQGRNKVFPILPFHEDSLFMISLLLQTVVFKSHHMRSQHYSTWFSPRKDLLHVESLASLNLIYSCQVGHAVQVLNLDLLSLLFAFPFIYQ